MEVRFYATLRPVVGGRSVTLPDDCRTIGEALSRLVQDYPALQSKLLEDHGAVRPHVVVMVGGRDIRHLNGLDTPLAGADGIDIFPPVAGGDSCPPVAGG